MGIEVLAGDFANSSASGARSSFSSALDGGAFYFPDPEVEFAWTPKTVRYATDSIAELEEISEDNKVRVLGAAGWGAIGALAHGPVGLLAGLVLGGRGKAVVFAVAFNDGKRALIKADKKTWLKIVAARFGRT